MTLEEFLEKYGIGLSDELRRVCLDGISLMRNTRDPMHSETHIHEILSYLDDFLQNERSIDPTVLDYSVLLPAICWHDAWKSGRSPTTNVVVLKFEQIWDGLGSRRCFRRYARKTSLERELVKKIATTIYLHAPLLQFLWKGQRSKKAHLHNPEARILRDLDRLEFWSLARIDHFAANFLDGNGYLLNPSLLRVCRWGYDSFVARTGHFFYDWPRLVYQTRKEEFLRRFRELLELNESVAADRPS
ncbi:hypothetical protein ACFL59_07930 [Planctomycetota bacterium]